MRDFGKKIRMKGIVL